MKQGIYRHFMIMEFCNTWSMQSACCEAHPLAIIVTRLLAQLLEAGRIPTKLVDQPIKSVDDVAWLKLSGYCYKAGRTPRHVFWMGTREVRNVFFEKAEDERLNGSTRKWPETRTRSKETEIIHIRHCFKSASETAPETAFIAIFLAQNPPSSRIFHTHPLCNII